MEECFRCRIDENHALLFDTISDEGIVKVCRKCSFEIDAPMIRPTPKEKLRESQLKKSVYERLSESAGINAIEHHRRINGQRAINEELEKQDKNLRKIIEQNIFQGDTQNKDERLINNFHWILMRARRHKKISIKEVAKQIGESEAMLTALEKGLLPRGYETAIRKIETYFGIRIFSPEYGQNKMMDFEVDVDKMRREFEERIEKSPKEVFDRKNPNQFTIGELREIKKTVEFKPNPKIFWGTREKRINLGGEELMIRKEESNKNLEPEFIGKRVDSEKEVKGERKELSEQEIRDLIFGKK